MKTTTNKNTMVTVKVASKELNIPKGKIKVMIKNGEISFELINGIYYVNVAEVKEVSLTNKIKKKSVGIFNKYEGSMENLEEFIDTFNDETVSIMNDKFGRKPLESNTFLLNWKILNKFNIYEIDNITLKLSQYFPSNSTDEFKETINDTHILDFIGITDNNIEKIIEYSIFEFDGYVFVWRFGFDDKLGYVINNIFRKDELKTSEFFTDKFYINKHKTLSSPYDTDEMNKVFLDYNNLKELKSKEIYEGNHLIEGHFTKDEIREFIEISDKLFDNFVENNLIGNKENEFYTLIDIEIIKYLLNIGITEDSTLSNINGNVLSVSFMERGSGYPPNYLKVS